MKTRTKVLGLLMAAVLLVTATVFGTMAYLTSKDTVTNTFTVGKVQITLDEAPVNTAGEVQTGERVKENTYKLMPGHTYAKDPTVTVKAGSEESYIRMLVTISNIENVKAALGAEFLPENFVNGTWDSTTWVSSDTMEKEGSAIYEFRYKETVAAPDEDVVLDDLFESFIIPGTVDNDGLAKLEGVTVTVIAQAIQADGFADANAAWNAFPAE